VDSTLNAIAENYIFLKAYLIPLIPKIMGGFMKLVSGFPRKLVAYEASEILYKCFAFLVLQ